MKAKTSFRNAVAAVTLLGIASISEVSGATFVVTNTGDSGPGSLRDAVAQSSVNGQPDTINFDPGVFSSPQTIVLASEISFLRDGANTGREVTVNGPGSHLLTISGNNATRLFSLSQLSDLTLRGVTLRDGNGVGTASSTYGGAIYAGVANLAIADVVVRNNSAGESGGGIYFGGGTQSRLSIADCLFTENIAKEGGGVFDHSGSSSLKSITNTRFSNNTGRASIGGATFGGGTTTITNCEFNENRAAVDLHGGIGGLNLFLTSGVVSDTTISNNSVGTMETTGGTGGVQANGNIVFRRVTVVGNSVYPRTGTNSDQSGGMHVSGSSSNGGLTVIDSLIAGNNGSDNAGGIYATGSLINIINTTVAGNSAASGGGVRNIATNLNIMNSTIVGNAAGPDDGAVSRFGGTVTVQNTIIAGTSTIGAGTTADVWSGTGSRQFVSNGYNIIGNPGNAGGTFGAAGDQVNVDPLMDPEGLRDNGGPTLTVALQPGSPAIDKGLSPDITTDQRGFARPFDDPAVANAPGGDGSDIGALENGAASQPLNISTRMRVLGGENALIGGFILTGSEPKRVLIRAIGPSLSSAGVEGALPDATLELFAQGESLAFNDNWRDSQEAEIAETTIPPSHELESAIVRTLAPGAYTAIVRGKDGTTGIALIEAYDLARGAQSKLANISSRGFVETGENVLIGGFIVGGDDTRVVVRAIGPSLAAAGVTDPLQDPTLQLIDGNGMVVQQNDNWKSDQHAEIEATGIPPRDEREAAIVATLARGSYTAIVRGQNNTAGVGLVEIYNIP